MSRTHSTFAASEPIGTSFDARANGRRVGADVTVR